MLDTTRLVPALGALFAAVALSCAVQPAPTSGGNAGAGNAGGGGDCNAACQHYLGCKGINTADAYDQCLYDCAQENPSAEEVNAFVQLDCYTAIQAIEEGGDEGWEEDTGVDTQGACNDCQGCMWDGETCYSGHAAAGAGTTIECDACCCAEGGPAQRWD